MKRHKTRQSNTYCTVNGPYLVVFADLMDQIGKSLVDVNSLLS